MTFGTSNAPSVDGNADHKPAGGDSLPARLGRRLTSRASRRATALSFVAAAVATLVVPAAPAQAVTTKIWPVCTPTANQSGWRYSTYSSHNPQRAVDINFGSGDMDRGKWVVASAAGTIHSKPVAAQTSYGKQVILRHGDGDFTQYAHLEWVTSLAPGTKVVKGQLIGTIGYSQNSSGARSYHLHYEQRTTATGSLRLAVINGAQLTYYTSGKAFVPTHVSPSCK